MTLDSDTATIPNHLPHVRLQDAPGAPRVLLLCGADLLESFATPGVWSAAHVRAIFEDFGVVCVPRQGTDTAALLARGVRHVQSSPVGGCTGADCHVLAVLRVRSCGFACQRLRSVYAAPSTATVWQTTPDQFFLILPYTVPEKTRLLGILGPLPAFSVC